jgi:hypothetical protein
MPLAIVAIVAMLLAFLAISPSADSPQSSGPAEVILRIDPPPTMIGFPPPLPYRNPHR